MNARFGAAASGAGAAWGYKVRVARAGRPSIENTPMNHPITGSTDPYLVHRLPIQRSDGVAYFKRKAMRGMRLEEKARRLLRGYRGP